MYLRCVYHFVIATINIGDYKLMSNFTIIAIYSFTVITLLWLSDLIDSYVFPTLSVEDRYGLHVTADDVSVILFAIVMTVVIVLTAWWIIIPIDTVTEWMRYSNRKWLM